MAARSDDERLKDSVGQTDARRFGRRCQGPKLFNRLITGQTAVDQMTGPPLNLSEAEAISRLRGSLIGP